MIDSKITQPIERDAKLVQAQRDELVERIARAIPQDGTVDPLYGIRLYRLSSTTEPLSGVFDPAFCVIAQGSKELYLGEECCTCGIESIAQHDPTGFLKSQSFLELQRAHASDCFEMMVKP